MKRMSVGIMTFFWLFLASSASGNVTYGTQDILVYEEILLGQQDVTASVVAQATGSIVRSLNLPQGAQFLETSAFSGHVEDTGLMPETLLSVRYGVFSFQGEDKFAVVVSPDVSTTREAYLGPLDLIVTDMTNVLGPAGAQPGDKVTTRAKIAVVEAPQDTSAEYGLDDLQVFVQRANNTGIIALGEPDTGVTVELVNPGRVTEGSELLKHAYKGLAGVGVFLAVKDGWWGFAAGVVTIAGLELKNCYDEIQKQKKEKKRDRASVDTTPEDGFYLTMRSSNPWKDNFGDVLTYPMDDSQSYTYLLKGNTVTAIPDPASLTLALLGLGTMGMLRRRKALR